MWTGHGITGDASLARTIDARLYMTRETYITGNKTQKLKKKGVTGGHARHMAKDMANGKKAMPGKHAGHDTPDTT